MSESCRSCIRFEASPAAIEAAFAGLATLSSAHAAVRLTDGLCSVHDRYVRASSACASHTGSTSTRQS